jgi:hypothetical protein
MVGDRQRHRHLAIGLLAKLPAVLMMHPDRMRAFLGKRCVVGDLIWESAELDEAHRLLRWAFDQMRRGRIEAVSGRPSIRAN